MRHAAFRRPLPLLIASLGALAGCGDGATTVTTPTVVLISVDTLRSDRLPAYGYSGVETPALDRLLAESVVFERAYSHYPLTLPSHASIFTGQLPPEHGVRSNKAFALPQDARTLAERLTEVGYRTGGFVSSMVLRAETGIAQGFERYEEPEGRSDSALTFAQQRGDRTLERARGWLRSQPPEQKLFLFFHSFDPHTPYDAPEPFAGRFADAYDAEVAYADQIVGGLLETLEELGRLQGALIVFLSDHGEGLGDHVEREHGIFLYRESLQVPLAIRLPGGERSGERIGDAAGLVDVAPTLLALLGLERDGLPGHAWLQGDAPEAGRTLYAESSFGLEQYGWSPLRSGLRDRLHYIEAPRPELYDVEADPQESQNLLPRERLPATLAAAVAEIGEGRRSTAALSPEAERQLAALGYVGGAVPEDDGTERPDPKDLIEPAMELWSLLDRIGKGESAGVELRAKELLSRVGMRREHLSRTVARNLLVAGHADAALEVLEPFGATEDPETLVALGDALTGVGRFAEARRRFEAALAALPSGALAHRGMGILLLSAGRPAEARGWLEQALELDDRLAEAWNALGVARAQGGDSAGAIEAWRRTVSIEPEAADAWYNLAMTLRARGERRAAAEALERYVPLVAGSERRQAERLLRQLRGAS
jgi:arylsulfatase A-like enzyme/Flp pilus assembly protein TadD